MNVCGISYHMKAGKTHKKISVFFSGRTTKSEGEVKPPELQRKKTLFSLIKKIDDKKGAWGRGGFTQTLVV